MQILSGRERRVTRQESRKVVCDRATGRTLSKGIYRVGSGVGSQTADPDRQHQEDDRKRQTDGSGRF